MAKVRQSGRRRAKTRIINENEVIVSGRDLVVPSPQNLPLGSSGVSVFQIVPANPVYWTGTRVSKIAEQYQLYRPLKFVVHYHPQVAVTNPGLVIYGTLMQDATMTPSELQQVLNTSNGGGIKECYSPFSSRVNMDRSFLQMQSYNVVGDPASTVNLPFLWLATYSGYASGAVSASSCPGWVEVEWTFRFSSANPGSANTGLGIYTTTESEVAQTTRRLASRGLRANFNLPFGVPIGLLKDLARPLLRHVGVLLLNGAESGTFRFGIGKVLTYIASNLLSAARNTNTTVVRDEDGVDVQLPDDTMVVVFMSGLPQPAVTTTYVPQPPATFDGLVIRYAFFETDFVATSFGQFEHDTYDVIISKIGGSNPFISVGITDGPNEPAEFSVWGRDEAGVNYPVMQAGITPYTPATFYPACKLGTWKAFLDSMSDTSATQVSAVASDGAPSVEVREPITISPEQSDRVMEGLDAAAEQITELLALRNRVQDALDRLQA